MPTYILKIRQPGQWFFRKYKLIGQAAQGDRLVLELASGSYRDIPNLPGCEIIFGKDMIEARAAAKKRQEETQRDNVSRAQEQGDV
jgi:hypothetical protein